MTHILIAEDETRISAFIEKGLRSHGFTTSVAKNANAALQLTQYGECDLLLLDLGLPGKDGLDVLEELRGQGVNLPIIILTAKNDIEDKVAGLESGADDYMTKPFQFAELLARVRLRLKKKNSHHNHETTQLVAGHITLDLRTRKAHIGSQEIELPGREFNLAETFFQHQGQVLSRAQLLDRVWGYDYDPNSNIVDVYVGYLRKKLGNDVIETIRGIGYRLQVS
ncbi:response regulator transcription factor [Pseudanabaena sp. ABRG5-3]|uniref:response regulator transcription factor n=1 Tax=Pseudanabaena sp. ABRG5-3 TaxID=685565 RepID=UPI000DC6E474|nr:response regulator transcription factor [Pseudanabaena sp. ABRG5-3]BBC26014.1 two-component response regulator [Pseudanabaena sp. ABRG5-3]